MTWQCDVSAEVAALFLDAQGPVIDAVRAARRYSPRLRPSRAMHADAIQAGREATRRAAYQELDARHEAWIQRTTAYAR